MQSLRLSNILGQRANLVQKWSFGQTLQRRSVSRQVWDNFGFLKDGTDFRKRQSISTWMMENPLQFRLLFGFALFGPMTFYFWVQGVFDYVRRVRRIVPLEPDWNSPTPFAPPEGYENPLFEPGRRWEAKREAKRQQRAQRMAEYEAKHEQKKSH